MAVSLTYIRAKVREKKKKKREDPFAMRKWAQRNFCEIKCDSTKIIGGNGIDAPKEGKGKEREIEKESFYSNAISEKYGKTRNEMKLM